MGLLEIAGTDKAMRGAALKNKDGAAKGYKPRVGTQKFVVYNLPDEWIKLITSDGLSVSSYARTAILEKLRRDGRIS